MWSYAFFIQFCSFLRSCVCGKGQKAEGPTRKLAGEPVQSYGRDYEVLIGFFVDRCDGFYLYLFLEAKFLRCEGRGVEFRRSEASVSRIRMSWKKGGHRGGHRARKKGVEGSCGVFLKRVGSYEGSMRYVRYGSLCARNGGVIERNGGKQADQT